MEVTIQQLLKSDLAHTDLELLVPVYENLAAGRSLFHVRHKVTQNHYALKVFDKTLINKKQLNTEVVVLNRLPFGAVPHVHRLDETRTYITLLIDWIDGQPFSQRFSQQPVEQFEVKQRISALIKAGWRLQSMHQQKLYHRDIKPDNLIWTGDKVYDPVYVIDLGSAAQKREVEEGTPGFRAPEQYVSRQQSVTDKTDVFGLAQALWFLITNEPADLSVNADYTDWDFPDYPMLPTFTPNARRLFNLLEQATQFQQKKRPTLPKFLSELNRLNKG
ncbi:protein kinase domain-containing protein [Idiomarina aminovorans]|uniref:protein kinase domain-containing protein n=1 Tax=Idiomarina aminovorans TaxID=2914829 RepID=UPI00200537B7|nr:protein kinase [Idiomarina sp. ATCH4]MCK7460411.1 protein kinase [Idiomarina sp. ATCH4]